ncbi:MAG TPA: PAS domain-containing protein [Chthoniobacteraceae bacterium]|nr:PAS domain-containing protein [Chthoniobacteraceae bacterium]
MAGEPEVPNGTEQQRLVQQSHLLENLLNASPDRIYFKDRRSRFIRMNHATALSFGLVSPGEAVGKTDADFFGEEHAREAYEDEQRIIATGEPIVGKEEKENWPDGRVTWASSSKYAMRNEKGEIIGIIGISRDITSRKEAEAQREKLLRELNGAFEKINTLKGLLPICASCKRIRDDSGSWAEVETYIQSRSPAHFSHGICPECAARLYPDIPELK